MNVTIVETKTGKVIGTFPVHLSGQNYTPTKEEYISMAWKCAVDDNLVDDERRAEFSFTISE